MISITGVNRKGTYSLGIIKDLKLRCILDVVDLGPVNRDRSTGLDMRENDLGARKSRGNTIDISVSNHDLLSFVKVGDISVNVNTAGEVAGTGTMARAAREQSKGEGLFVNLGSLDLGETIDNGQDKVAQLANSGELRTLVRINQSYSL